MSKRGRQAFAAGLGVVSFVMPWAFPDMPDWAWWIFGPIAFGLLGYATLDFFGLFGPDPDAAQKSWRLSPGQRGTLLTELRTRFPSWDGRLIRVFLSDSAGEFADYAEDIASTFRNAGYQLNVGRSVDDFGPAQRGLKIEVLHQDRPPDTAVRVGDAFRAAGIDFDFLEHEELHPERADIFVYRRRAGA